MRILKPWKIFVSRHSEEPQVTPVPIVIAIVVKLTFPLGRLGASHEEVNSVKFYIRPDAAYLHSKQYGRPVSDYIERYNIL